MPKALASKPRPLPRGPHALSREEVEQSQRQRLFMAMIETVAERGYAQTSVADVLARSGVSRATFYALFTDKDDCFRAAYEMAASQMAAALGSGLFSLLNESETAPQDALERLDRILGLYLDMLAGQPAFARTFLVEVFAAGPVAIAQRQASLEAFVDLVAMVLDGRPGLLGSAPEQRFAVRMLVHGVSSMVTGLIGRGQTEKLPELKAPLMELAKSLLAVEQA